MLKTISRASAFTALLLAAYSAGDAEPATASGAMRPPAAPRSAAMPSATRESFELDRMPQPVFEAMLSSEPLVGLRSLAWDRSQVSVAFEGGSDPLYALIEETAAEWTRHGGGMKFSFRDARGRFRRWSAADTSAKAAIRISFRSGADEGGYWSVLGTLARNIAPGQPTMNYEGFPTDLAPYYDRASSQQWLNSYARLTILHEFGHALGLSHEHFHPDCQKDLDLTKAVAGLKQPPNDWTEEQARFNVDADYYFKVMKELIGLSKPGSDDSFDLSPSIDRASVMLYSFNDVNVYRSGTRSACRPSGRLGYATSLSQSDLAAFVSYYPKR